MAQFVFLRTEKKYLLTEEEYRRVVSVISGAMEPDAYFRYTICNLYYDTDDFTLVSRSIEKPVYKEKLRMRSYGVPGEGDTVFFEMKKKYLGTVYKRRIALPVGEAVAFADEGVTPQGVNPQIVAELEYFMDFYNPEARVFLAYDREAYRGKSGEPELRVTFDRDIRYRTDALDLRGGDCGEQLLPDGGVVMEVKTGLTLPLWLSDLLNAEKIYPASFSKYGRVYQKEFENIRRRIYV